ncbi:hypothetical protein L6R53_20090 [Myxococcota bacterium]|nr:hypothetical protein [Myxococcota bacterium]
MSTSRRGILKIGLGGAALLAAGGLGLGLWPGASREPLAPLQALSPRAFGVLAAVARTFCPGGDGLPSADELDIAGALDATIATLHPADQAELQQVLLLVDNALVGALLDGRPQPFSRADDATRRATLLSWRESRIPLRRTAYKALRGLVMAAYWGHPRLYAAAGYPGPPDFGQAQAPPDDPVALAEEGRRRLAGDDAPEGQPPAEALDPVEESTP